MTRPQRFLILPLLLGLALGLAACGKKGDPRLPEGEVGTYPRTYPAPESVVPQSSSDSESQGEGQSN